MRVEESSSVVAAHDHGDGDVRRKEALDEEKARKELKVLLAWEVIKSPGRVSRFSLNNIIDPLCRRERKADLREMSTTPRLQPLADHGLGLYISRTYSVRSAISRPSAD